MNLSFLKYSLISVIIASSLSACRGSVVINPATSFSAFNSQREIIDPLVEKSRQKAVETIKGNTWTVTIKDDQTKRKVIVAGKTHFQDLWARDGLWGAMGALQSGNPDTTRDVLRTFLDFQFEDGMISRRMGSGKVEVNLVLKTIGLFKPNKENFDTIDNGKSGSWWTGTKGSSPGHAPDSNMIVTIVAGEYLKKTDDLQFLQQYYGRLNKSLSWLKTQVNANGLIVQPGVGDWKDTVNRGTVVMYNQALYFQTLKAMSFMAQKLGKSADSAYFYQQAEEVKQSTNTFFWDPIKGHFKDSEWYSHFSPDGNLFAIAFGLATAEQAKTIFAKCDELISQNPVFPATDGLYPKKQTGIPHRLTGMSDYHDRVRWPWQNSLYALAAERAGDHQRATKALKLISEVIEKDGDFFETYQPDSPVKPVKRTLYSSERGFSWSAGMYLFAYSEIYKRATSPLVF